MRDLSKDLRFAFRMLVKSPLFTLVAIVSLALGIGVNTAFFSLINAVFWTTLPMHQPQQLVEIYTRDSSGFIYGTSSYPDYREIRDENEVFTSVACENQTLASIDVNQETRLSFGELVSGNYFSTLGVQAHAGRMLNESDDRKVGAHPVVVIGYRFWERVLGKDPEVLGSTLEISGSPFEIVGIAPQEFTSSMKILAIDFWVTSSMLAVIDDGEDLNNRGGRSLRLVARLKPGVSLQQAQANLDVIQARLEQEYPQFNKNRDFSLMPTDEVVLHPVVDSALTPVAALLMGLFGLVLLVACTNLASLLLARSSSRAREIAVRLAMGAGRARIIRQLLCENLMLALSGGLIGVGLAFLLGRLLLAFQPPIPLPLSLDLSPDLRVLFFALGLSLATGLLFGLAPAWRSSRPDLVPALKNEEMTFGGSRRFFTFRNLLVMAQVTLSLVLLVASGLFVRSLGAAQSISVGFEMEEALLLKVDARLSGHEGSQGARRMAQALKERIASLAGVKSVSVASKVPLGMEVNSRGFHLPGDARPQPGDPGREVDAAIVDENYFEALDIPILRGRDFEAGEDESSPLTVVISQAMAQRYWPGQDPLGQTLRYRGFEGPEAEIVGIAQDTKVRTLGEAPRPYLYLNFYQNPVSFQSFIIRTQGPPQALQQTVRREVKEEVPGLAMLEFKTMDEHLALGLFPIRMAGYVLAGMGALALLLAVTGVYGVLSYSVAGRTREVGIRMALGADRRAVIGQISWQGMKVVIPGILMGLAGAAALSGLLSSLLVGIEALDPLTFLLVPVLLAGVALAAALVPARRAARISPLDALRYE
ncbi:MAG TPA: ABC transporter permease [Acidobacteriota bacterium]|nr:ABC transporter permease [Acidobacteriota bacterium]